MGPKIIENAPSFERARSRGRETGVRWSGGAWHAIRDGKLVGSHRGSRGFLQASREAGSRTVLR